MSSYWTLYITVVALYQLGFSQSFEISCFVDESISLLIFPPLFLACMFCLFSGFNTSSPKTLKKVNKFDHVSSCASWNEETRKRSRPGKCGAIKRKKKCCSWVFPLDIYFQETVGPKSTWGAGRFKAALEGLRLCALRSRLPVRLWNMILFVLGQSLLFELVHFDIHLCLKTDKSVYMILVPYS